MVKEFTKGLWKENPVFVQLLGLCPTLAVTGSAINGVGMGLATTFVLICSSTIISLLKKAFPPQVRIVCYIAIIATFVTVADLFMKAMAPELSNALGPYVPLITVNCVILGRAEAFANKNGIVRSFVDALGMGAGITFALLLLGMLRELLGSGALFGIPILGAWFAPWLVMILPAGAFFGLSALLAIKNFIDSKLA